jgi:hypothetical protein
MRDGINQPSRVVSFDTGNIGGREIGTDFSFIWSGKPTVLLRV